MGRPEQIWTCRLAYSARLCKWKQVNTMGGSMHQDPLDNFSVRFMCLRHLPVKVGGLNALFVAKSTPPPPMKKLHTGHIWLYQYKLFTLGNVTECPWGWLTISRFLSSHNIILCSLYILLNNYLIYLISRAFLFERACQKGDFEDTFFIS